MNALLLHAVGVFLVFGIAAALGGYVHENLWHTSKPATPLARTVALTMAPWWIVATFLLLGFEAGVQVSKNFWGLISKGDY